MAVKTPHDSYGTPDRVPLKKAQAQRLASLTGLKAEDLAGKAVVDIESKYRWIIDPIWFNFRRICGRVVRKDPSTGVEYPVPFATVHVEDTDCSLISYFPKAHPWGWYFPFHCRREEIGTVKTDACGRFCVWIPRFDIDWILRWRKERICFPDIFVKPSILDILKYLVETKVPHLPPGPDPDPGPLLEQLGPDVLKRLGDLVGDATANRLSLLRVNTSFGRDASGRDQLLSAPAFSQPLPPPLPAEFHTRTAEAAKSSPARGTLAATLNLNEAALQDFHPSRYIGPFWRCFDIYLPEWNVIFDVPDITFRVTQDVNNDGTEETIYSEGYFDVRWDDTTTNNVTLYASSIAQISTVCEPPVVPCGNTPEILFAGLMKLTPVPPPPPVPPVYLDGSTGFAIRPNRPHPSGNFTELLPRPAATAPFCQTLQLYGCTRIPNAAFYRVRRSTGGGSPTPFVGLTWPLNRAIGGPPWQIWPTSDPSGWYPVLNPADNWFPPDLLLEWSTSSFNDDVYELDVQVADAAKNVIATSSKVRLVIDNSYPLAEFKGLRWRFLGGGWHVLPLICPVIARGVNPQDIEVEVDYSVLANHLRSVRLNDFGCGGGNQMSPQSALSTIEHWHTGPGDNSVAQTARYLLSSVKAPGSYGFSIDACSRAFNPSGGDGGHLVDWNYDPVFIRAIPQINIAIVNA